VRRGGREAAGVVARNETWLVSDHPVCGAKVGFAENVLMPQPPRLTRGMHAAQTADRFVITFLSHLKGLIFRRRRENIVDQLQVFSRQLPSCPACILTNMIHIARFWNSKQALAAR
jgi:hypothetical protein